MPSAVIGLITLVVGIVATFLVARHYYRRSVDKQLTPYIRKASMVFGGIAPDVRDQLKIFYNDTEVPDIFELEFVIINEGERPIRDIIKPLSLELPTGVEVLDSRVVSVNPEGREVDLRKVRNGDSDTLIYEFPLLNSDEYFTSRALIKGAMEFKDINFSITADDLPPTLSPQWIPYYPAEQRGVDTEFIVVGIIFIIVSITSFIGQLLLFQADPGLSILSETFDVFSWTGAVLLFWTGGYLVTAFVAVLTLIFAFRGVRWKTSKKLPPHLYRHHIPTFVVEEVIKDTGNKSASD